MDARIFGILWILRVTLLFREDLQSPCSVASMQGPASPFFRVCDRANDSIESVRKGGEKYKEKKEKYIDSVSMFQCSIARFFSTRDSRGSMHGSYVTRRTTRNAKLSRFEMTRRDRGRDVIISLLSLYIARIDASSVNRFVGKSPLESVRLLRAKRWRKTNIYVATIYASNYFPRDSRRTENRR